MRAASLTLAMAGSIGGLVRSLGERDAQAMTAVELTLGELVDGSTVVVVGAARESTSVWEDGEGARGRRIVTYTRVEVEQVLDGDAPLSPVWVRTLGGAVDTLGQRVEGEAVLVSGRSVVLFLKRRSDATFAVVGMSQGQFVLEGSSSQGSAAKRVLRAGPVDMLVPPSGASSSEPGARATLAGHTLDEAKNIIRTARGTRAK